MKLFALEKMLHFKQEFDQDAKLPKTEEEFRTWFIQLVKELEPEKLSSGGEATRAEMRERKKELDSAWTELEFLRGKKVSFNEAESWLFESVKST
jgi:hypothetical protein